jgi:deoxycytidine triphosphate deaminase
MYLTDRQLRERLSALAFVTDVDEQPFSPDEQIQPCSIDLRLSNVFWRPMRSRGVDMRKAHVMEVAPRRHWRRTVLSAGEYITLKPGRILLGRTYEAFSIPPDCAGKLEGRSSFSRLGLAIHCTGDFINPGWRGHMPLQLLNFGRTTIKIVPHVPIAQLLLLKLNERPERIYGDPTLESKYMDDDGGPSFWWRDRRIRALHARLRQADISLSIQERLVVTLQMVEPDVIERFESLIDKNKNLKNESADALLHQFTKAEKRLRRRDTLLKWGSGVLFTASLSLALRQVLQTGLDNVFWVLASVTVLLGLIATRMVLAPTRTYLEEDKKRQ